MERRTRLLESDVTGGLLVNRGPLWLSELRAQPEKLSLRPILVPTNHRERTRSAGPLRKGSNAECGVLACTLRRQILASVLRAFGDTRLSWTLSIRPRVPGCAPCGRVDLSHTRARRESRPLLGSGWVPWMACARVSRGSRDWGDPPLRTHNQCPDR